MDLVTLKNQTEHISEVESRQVTLTNGAKGLRKLVNLERKAVTFEADFVKTLMEDRGLTYWPGAENYTLRFIASTDAEDRDRDVIHQEGWLLDDYRQNSVVLWSHRMGDPPIGRSLREEIYADASLVEAGQTRKLLIMDEIGVTPGIYPFADAVWEMAKAGFVTAGSVGFIPLKIADRMEQDADGTSRWTGGFDLLENELLEHSLCSVPCNQEALQLAADMRLGKSLVENVFEKPTDDQVKWVLSHAPARRTIVRIVTPDAKSLESVLARRGDDLTAAFEKATGAEDGKCDDISEAFIELIPTSEDEKRVKGLAVLSILSDIRQFGEELMAAIDDLKEEVEGPKAVNEDDDVDPILGGIASLIDEDDTTARAVNPPDHGKSDDDASEGLYGEDPEVKRLLASLVGEEE